MDGVRQAAEWDACADAYWSAARLLAEADSDLELPRLRLASLALEYRLRSFVCTVRGGTPGGDDLGRLMRLAVFCGLRLEAAERDLIERLGRVHRGDADTAAAPAMAHIDRLLAGIAAQSRPAA